MIPLIFSILPQILTANGDCVVVIRTSTVEISPSINLRNCLLSLNLTHKLLFVNQLTKELNCTDTMSSTNCVVKDDRTRKII